jgi:hypothetical protein
MGTGLSHELTGHGPGTWWEDLGVAEAASRGRGIRAFADA